MTDKHAPRRSAMTPAAWVGVMLSLGTVVGGFLIVFVGTIKDIDGNAVLENPSGVLIALIGAIGLVASTIVPQVVQIKRHVENGHRDALGRPIGLRDDLDAKHLATLSLLGQISSAQTRADQRLAEVEEHTRTLADRVTANRERIKKLEGESNE